VAEIIYLNGQLVPRFEAKLSPFDHGFLYGYGLFETMRAYNGHIFRLDSHLTRLRCSAESIGLTHSILTTDEGKQSLKTACVPEKYETGFKAAVSSLRRNSQSPLSRLKSTCYMENILARMAARAAGCDESIFLNEQGYLAEGSTTNVFLVSNGELITPCLESGVLPGITREAVLEIARASHLKATERWVNLNELVEAQEAFLTNSILELMSLVSIEGRTIGSGKPGKLTRDLLFAYRELVRKATLGRTATSGRID